MIERERMADQHASIKRGRIDAGSAEFLRQRTPDGSDR
jgi:hypothetical protein